MKFPVYVRLFHPWLPPHRELNLVRTCYSNSMHISIKTTRIVINNIIIIRQIVSCVCILNMCQYLNSIDYSNTTSSCMHMHIYIEYIVYACIEYSNIRQNASHMDSCIVYVGLVTFRRNKYMTVRTFKLGFGTRKKRKSDVGSSYSSNLGSIFNILSI